MNVDTIAEPAEPVGGDAPQFSDADACGPELPPPLVRIREEHNISRRDIDPDALKVLYRLARNGYTAYLVGGGVRDLLLGRRPKDFDISTNAKPEEIRALFRNCILIGRRFRLAHIRYGEKIIETSTFRRTPENIADPADPEADLFQRDDNIFGTPQEDALRRDFTVNGLFYDIESFSIIDYVGGMDDLAAKRIRSIGNPCIRFREDPVRMIRAIRFASRLGFELDDSTRDAIVKYGEELAKAAPARLLEEIARLFAFSSGEKAVRLLQSTGLLRVALPEVSEALEFGTEHSGGLWNRLRALDEGDTVMPDATPALVFSTLLLDALRARIGSEWPPEEIPRLKFDKVHAFLEPLSQRLRFPRKLVDRIVHIYLAQHRFANTGGKRGSIANFVTQDSFHEALALAEIVRRASGRPQTELNHWRDMLAERIYGRDDGRGEHERRRHRGDSPDSETRNGETRESDGGEAKLSRSARRRRNKRMRRQRCQDAPERKDAQIDGEARAAVESGDAPPPAPVVPPTPAAPVEAETVQASVAMPAKDAPETAESAKKNSRAKSRREKPKRKRERAGPATEAVSVAGAPAIVPGEEKESYRPLTAAAFYSGPEPGKGKTGVKKRGGGKSVTKTPQKEPEGDDMIRAPEKPLTMDRADEADTPMHWLDEI